MRFPTQEQPSANYTTLTMISICSGDGTNSAPRRKSYTSRFARCVIVQPLWLKKARSKRQRAERELTEGERDGRRDLADRYQKDAEAAQWELKKLTKAQATLDQRRERLEEQMRQA